MKRCMTQSICSFFCPERDLNFSESLFYKIIWILKALTYATFISVKKKRTFNRFILQAYSIEVEIKRWCQTASGVLQIIFQFASLQVLIIISNMKKSSRLSRNMQIWEKVRFGCFEQLQICISRDDGINLKIIFNDSICI